MYGVYSFFVCPTSVKAIVIIVLLGGLFKHMRVCACVCMFVL